MFLRTFAALAAAFALASTSLAQPATTSDLETRAPPDLQVWVTSSTDFCLILPRAKYSTIGDSEYPGGARSYCTKRYDSSQGKIPAKFFTSGPFVSKKRGQSGGRQVQLTGCINASASPRLQPNDGGGQYDSAPGGTDGKGNPAGSVCLGYNHYVQIIEPDANRVCIRCCDNQSDCPLQFDTSGCKRIIPGRYDGC